MNTPLKAGLILTLVGVFFLGCYLQGQRTGVSPSLRKNSSQSFDVKTAPAAFAENQSRNFQWGAGCLAAGLVCLGWGGMRHLRES